MRYYKSSFSAIVFAHLILLGFIYFYAIQPIGALTYKNVPFPTVKDSYRPGDAVEIVRLFCVKDQYRFTVRPRLVDGSTTFLNEFNGQFINTGCQTKTDTTIVIPRSTNPGKYYIQGYTDVHINLFRDKTFRWQTQEFTVIK